MTTRHFYSEILRPILGVITKLKDRNAFCIEDRFYTYMQLGECTSAIQDIVANNTESGQRVGLVINNDLQTYASILALWLTGKSYVPLHPQWPLDRCLDIICQVGLDTILDSSPETRYDTQRVIGTSALPSDNHAPLRVVDVPDSELAYILFTSGSTGRPKGVQITRKNVAAFLNSFWKTGISITREDRCLQCFDLSFDVSVQSFLVALTRGACVYTVPYGQAKFLSVADLIDCQRITFGAIAPSTLRYLQPYFSELNFSDFRQCIITAEAGQMDLVREWLKYAPGTSVYDFYGPTEGTVYATWYKVRNDDTDKTYNGIISIGKPLANVRAYILDEEGHLLDAGEKGELCIAGPQVTPGYWDNDEKNREVFSDMNIGGERVRIYHTGDLCFQDGEGDILYSGRIDNQAKIQGFRVELSEIEFHAREFLNGINVVCLAIKNELQLDEIVLVVESVGFDTTELVAYLRTKMPHYMIPSRFCFNEHFPINANGKIDRKSIQSLLDKS